MAPDPAPADATFARSPPSRDRPPTAATKGPAPGSYLAPRLAARPSGRAPSRYNAPCMSATPDTEPTPDPELFREVFGRFATGVAVITSAGPGGIGGMTANALCSLSLDPLLALVCFENEARTLPIVRDAGRFGVNVLSAASGGRRGRVRLEAARGREARRRRPPLRGRRSDHRRLDRLGGVRAARADRGRRPHDRDRRGPRAGARRGRAAAVVRRPLPRVVEPARSSRAGVCTPAAAAPRPAPRASSRPARAGRSPPRSRAARPRAARRPLGATRGRAASSTICAAAIRSCSAISDTSSGSTP